MRVLNFIVEATRSYRLYLAGVFLVVCLVSFDGIVKPYLVKRLIDTATHSIFTEIWILAAWYIGLQVLHALTWVFSDWLGFKYHSPLRVHIASVFLEKLSLYSYRFFQNNLAGSLTTKISDAFSAIPSLIFIFNHKFIHFTLTTLFTLILLGQVHSGFALGLLAWISLFLCRIRFTRKKLLPIIQSYAESKSTLFGQVSDYISNMINVRLFTTHAFEQQRFDHLSQDFIHKSRVQILFMIKFYFEQGMVVSLYSGLFLGGLLYMKQYNLITAGDFALVFMLNFRMFDKMFGLSHDIEEFLTQWGTLDQALKLLEVSPKIQDKPAALPLRITRGDITFDQVKFHYPGSEDLFENKSITLFAGQKVGLVGSSGGGKSTFVHLILRLYDVTEGRILIDGQDIRDVTQDSLRSAIGMIPQDPSLFHRSLRDNIRYGRTDATDEEVVEAAKQAYAHDFIMSLPQGYDSLVGERGVKLSGGQRQRIAIARAILKNVSILILDEATSQLDSMTESDLQQSLWNLMEGKTALVVAHRLSTLLHMDRILVFKQGRIVEDGPHETLLAQDGLYKKLWDAQVGGFLLDEGIEA